ncbi:hypothetical protein HZA75_03120 [Candidatus Roizmanbacteria bacterium]|nr:hypothetical protein [Candidatus Roizmanbacteria bacterium]
MNERRPIISQNLLRAKSTPPGERLRYPYLSTAGSILVVTSLLLATMSKEKRAAADVAREGKLRRQREELKARKIEVAANSPLVLKAVADAAAAKEKREEQERDKKDRQQRVLAARQTVRDMKAKRAAARAQRRPSLE